MLIKTKQQFEYHTDHPKLLQPQTKPGSSQSSKGRGVLDFAGEECAGEPDGECAEEPEGKGGGEGGRVDAQGHF